MLAKGVSFDLFREYVGWVVLRRHIVKFQFPLKNPFANEMVLSL